MVPAIQSLDGCTRGDLLRPKTQTELTVVYITFLGHVNNGGEISPRFVVNLLSKENVQSWKMGRISELWNDGHLAALERSKDESVLSIHKKFAKEIIRIKQKNLPRLLLEPNHDGAEKKSMDLGSRVSLTTMNRAQKKKVKTIVDSFQKTGRTADANDGKQQKKVAELRRSLENVRIWRFLRDFFNQIKKLKISDAPKSR